MPHSRREHQQSGTTGSCNPGESSGEGSGRKKGTCHWAIADVWAAIAERKRNRGQESPQTQITQEEVPKAKQRRQEDGTGMTTEGAWQTERQQPEAEGGAAEEGSKSHGQRQDFPIRVSALQSVGEQHYTNRPSRSPPHMQ